jgi:colicin import membrane protein
MAAIKQETAGGAPYYVPPEPKRWPAIGLAVGVHALLLAFLVIGVSWQNHEPVAVEAEVWDLKTQVAAPPPPPPQPAPEPQEETPPPQPAPKVAPPPPVEQPAPPRQPDIALEREKKRKEELKQQKLEEQRLERERELAEQKAEEKKAEEKKAKALADKKAREEADKRAEQARAEELAKKEEAEKKKKEKADKLAKEKAQKAEDAKLAKLRDAEMKRMMAAADNAGSGSTGTAAKSTAPTRDNGYIGAITAKVKGNSSYGGDLDQPGNPTVSFHVEQLPTGEIISVRKTRSSGIAAFDDAVEKAINKSSPLPKKKDGTVERSLEINFHMKDMQ